MEDLYKALCFSSSTFQGPTQGLLNYVFPCSRSCVSEDFPISGMLQGPQQGLMSGMADDEQYGDDGRPMPVQEAQMRALR